MTSPAVWNEYKATCMVLAYAIVSLVYICADTVAWYLIH